MQVGLLQVLPELGSQDVTEGIDKVMGDQRGRTGGTGGEVTQHDIIIAGHIVAGRTDKLIAFGFDQIPEADVAGTAAVYHGLAAFVSDLGQTFVDVGTDAVIGNGDDHLDFGQLSTVGNVLGGEHVGSGDCGDTELAQRGHENPELIAALDHDDHSIAAAKTQTAQGIGGTIGFPTDLGEGKGALGSVVVAPYQSTLFGFHAGPFVHNVIAEVELFGDVDGKIVEKVLVGGVFGATVTFNNTHWGVLLITQITTTSTRAGVPPIAFMP